MSSILSPPNTAASGKPHIASTTRHARPSGARIFLSSSPCDVASTSTSTSGSAPTCKRAAARGDPAARSEG